ncbi:MAG: hypothetical protein IJL32_10720 [Oscillospiraceae bacterium]|nr:hypothetical protein [Oscillospiraceae bacterium]
MMEEVNKSEVMKKVERRMGILMGVSLSLCLSLFGCWFSGHFSLGAFVTSFLISTVISLLIGFLIPTHKIGIAACRKLRAQEHSLKGGAVTSLVSDLIYTPLISLVMTAHAFNNALKHGASISFGGMFVTSLLPSLLIGFVLIFILTPLFVKMLLKKEGIQKPE